MKNRGQYCGLSLILIILTLLPACNSVATPQPVKPNIVLADVTFNATLLSAGSGGKTVYLDILDEVTGLALNPVRYSMTRVDDTHYSLRLPFAPGAVVKYRYAHEAAPAAIEHTLANEQVRYRLFYVTNPAVVEDIVSGWGDILPDHSKAGQIQGVVFDANHNALADILIIAGGMQTISAADGSFTLDGLSPGVHNLVAYSMDGAYLPFQQGARIENGAVTSVVVLMEPVKFSNITFLVKTPAPLPQGAVLRLIGNITPLGNTFSDLEGGMNTVIERALPLSSLPDGSYTASIKLPAGLDLRYKYTLGDGLWNAEHTPSGTFNIRQMIVPNQDAMVQDTIDTWGIGNDSAPITFHVSVPASTPSEDTIAIQFNPYGWTSPLPMWKTGGNEWTFTLYSPQQILGEISYRYCRSRVCGTTQTAGDNQFYSKTEPQTFSDVINRWDLWQPAADSTRLEIAPVKPRNGAFFAGVEMDDLYHPAWLPGMDVTFNNIHDLGANWVIFKPSCSLTDSTKSSIELAPAANPLIADESRMIQSALEKGISPAVFPVLQSSRGILKWWEAAPKDEAWWDQWFSRYRVFILNQAALAEKNGVKVFMIGDPAVVSALYNIRLPDGSSTNPPPDYKTRWQNLVNEIRNQYHGALVGVLIYPLYQKSMPPYAELVDQFYILYSPKLERNADSVTLQKEVKAGIIQNVKPMIEQFSKPAILGISYPSMPSAYEGCEDFFQECWPQQPVSQPEGQITEGLTVQQNIYQAFFNAVNDLDWISGMVARGYYPPVALFDSTPSIHGKPAASVVWYWFTHALGK